MEYFFQVMFTVVRMIIFPLLLPAASSYVHSENPRMVFAHYMLYQPVGNAIYKQEIRLAQSKGIDAFALNSNVWRPSLADEIYLAAKELGTGFKLFFSADCHKDSNGNLSVDDLVQMIVNYKGHPNQLRYQGKQFFSAWAGDNDAWWQDNGEINTTMGWQTVFDRSVGRSNIFFVPFFSGTDGSSVGAVDYLLNKVVSVVDGLYAWDTSAWPYYSSPYTVPDDSRDKNFNTSCTQHNKLYMASVSPWFYNNYGGCETVKGDYEGPNLWIQRWTQIIQNNIPLVEIVTWNDWVESTYVAPQFSTVGAAYNVTDFPHQAFLNLGQHYIRWYKAGGGAEPTPCTDSLYMFYYTKQAAAGGCTRLNSDKVYVVAMVKSPATVQIQSGSGVTTCIAPTGVSICAIDFAAGHQIARLTRGGEDVISQGEVRGIDINPFTSGSDYNVYCNCNCLGDHHTLKAP